MPRLIALAVLAALALAACGSDEPSPKEGVRDTVTAFRDATADRDYGKICKDVLAPKLVDRLGDLGLPCETALSKYLTETRKPQIKIRRVAVRGKRAQAFVTARAAGQAPADEVLGLVETKDGWRIATLGTRTTTSPTPAPGTGD